MNAQPPILVLEAGADEYIAPISLREPDRIEASINISAGDLEDGSVKAFITSRVAK